MLGRHRGQPDRVCETASFHSSDDALRDSDLPGAQEDARKLGDVVDVVDVVDGEPELIDIDIDIDIDIVGDRSV